MTGKWSEISVTTIAVSKTFDMELDRMLSIRVEVVGAIRVGLVITGKRWLVDKVSKKLFVG